MLKLFGFVLMGKVESEKLSRSVSYGNQDTLGWGATEARKFLDLVHGPDFIIYSGKGQRWSAPGLANFEPLDDINNI